MADINPNVPPGAGPVPPTGAPLPAAPPKPGESGKIQPKKETVRINLPPKPTAAPTIKIPAPSAIHSAAPAAAAPMAPVAAPVGAPAAPRTAAAPVAAAAAPVAAAPRPAAGAPVPARPAAAPVYASAGYDAVDKALAIAAAVVALAALIRVVTL